MHTDKHSSWKLFTHILAHNPPPKRDVSRVRGRVCEGDSQAEVFVRCRAREIEKRPNDRARESAWNRAFYFSEMSSC